LESTVGEKVRVDGLKVAPEAESPTWNPLGGGALTVSASVVLKPHCREVLPRVKVGSVEETVRRSLLNSNAKPEAGVPYSLLLVPLSVKSNPTDSHATLDTTEKEAERLVGENVKTLEGTIEADP
jgi:hypothetical protein